MKADVQAIRTLASLAETIYKSGMEFVYLKQMFRVRASDQPSFLIASTTLSVFHPTISSAASLPVWDIRSATQGRIARMGLLVENPSYARLISMLIHLL